MAPKKGWKRPPFSEETKRRISEGAKRRFADAAQRQAMSEALKATWAKGTYANRQRVYEPLSEEQKAHLREVGKKRYADPAARAAQSAKWTPEMRAKAAEYARKSRGRKAALAAV